ncbi:MAG: hypothetical protein EON59_17355 [Alphaproteobacteria bacterium]|nr:MAG: hypothetical protein EON59_17355 [Alphaproteobacteria bacterium]
MIQMRNVSVALLLAALAMNPLGQAMAAANAAKMVTGMKTEAAPVATLTGMIGTWTPADLTSLDKAASVKVFDTRTIYDSADLLKVSSAETAKAAELGKFHDAIRGDAALKGWFDTNKIDVNKVVAVSMPNGTPELFLY